MEPRQARKTGWILIATGCVFIVFAHRWPGMALVVAGLILLTAGAKCPHCGKFLATLSPFPRKCPRCGWDM